MPHYPVRVPTHPYGGRDPRKTAKRDRYNRVADKVEQYLNDELRTVPDGTYSFTSHEIARAIQEDSDLVHEVVFGIDCGHNGVTIRKGDWEAALERQMKET